ncbi:MAG: GNAT family N-acetyltransferase [Crocinitomicaceae bacterium]|nr:GNAT family N-acetyltransferase [Crocinitomicaceae bacterium]|tara:strand:+ start:822 stop:1271 length:450 start_codon:yes stop_codon:yes gene_type:complete
MNILIRKGKKEDVNQVFSLINELADFEKSIDEVSITTDDLLKDGFRDNPYYRFIVAEKSSEIIGVAIYFYRYSTWKGRVLYLEDFIVKSQYRNTGIGTKIFDEIKLIGKEMNVKSIVWQVLNWNEMAISFYKKHGAIFSNQWLNGRIEL